MKTTRSFSLLCISLAIFALPAAAQSPNDRMCDGLADATPGLKGLCVALCEAQACQGIYDPVTKEVTFDPSCNPSAKSIYANYNKMKTEADPPMPCVRVPCPCWAESEIDQIGGATGNPASDDQCTVGKSFAQLFGFDTTVSNGVELASTIKFSSGGARCSSMRQTPSVARGAMDNRDAAITAEEFEDCKKSVVDECTQRGVPIRFME